MTIGKYATTGMIALGILGTSVSVGYILYHDQIERGLRDKISNVEKILTQKEKLGNLDKNKFSEEYIKATEEEIARLENQYQEQSRLSDLSSLRSQLGKTITIEVLDAFGFVTSLTVLSVGLAKRFPEKKEE